MKKIALAQINIEYGNFESNVNKMNSFITSACNRECDILLMPELWSSGFDLRHIDKYPEKNKEILTHLQEIASQNSISIGGSIITRQRDTFHNSFVYIQPDKPYFIYHKIHLFALMREDRYFKSGKKSKPFESTLGNSGAAVCFDLRFPDHFLNLTHCGTEFFFLPAHWPLARIHHWNVLLQARAIENQAYMIAVNSVGKSGNDIYGGHSMVIAPDGEILLQASDVQEGLFIIEIDPSKAAKIRKTFPMYR